MKYYDSSFSSGFFASETLTLTPTVVINNFRFGCGQDNKGIFNRTAGILGLGRNPVSLIQQTTEMFHNIFSYCLPSTPSNVGFLNFGGAVASDNISYTPLFTLPQSSSYYGLNITGIALAGTNLPIYASMFSSGTIIDSGTVITRLPSAAYASLRDSFRNEMSMYPMTDPDGSMDTCYNLSGIDNVVVPKVTLSFEGGVSVELSASGVLFAESETLVCLAFAASEHDSDFAIIANTQQRTLEVVYDVDGGRIGFRPASCN